MFHLGGLKGFLMIFCPLTSHWIKPVFYRVAMVLPCELYLIHESTGLPWHLTFVLGEKRISLKLKFLPFRVQSSCDSQRSCLSTTCEHRPLYIIVFSARMFEHCENKKLDMCFPMNYSRRRYDRNMASTISDGVRNSVLANLLDHPFYKLRRWCLQHGVLTDK